MALSPQVSLWAQQARQPQVRPGLSLGLREAWSLKLHADPIVVSAVIETRPSLWAESATPLEPWTQLTLTCRARLETLNFQLLKDGVALEPMRLDVPAIAHRFVLGDVTKDNRGLYHCRAGLGERWTQLSDLVEVTGIGEKGASGATLHVVQHLSLSCSLC